MSDPASEYPIPLTSRFFIIMNIAVGGNYVGNPSTNTINASTTFPGQMLVDYVRLYNLTGPLQLAGTDRRKFIVDVADQHRLPPGDPPPNFPDELGQM